METKQPMRVFRAGRVTCAIWEQGTFIDGVSKSILRATVSKRYKTRYGHWRSSFSFLSDEILVAIDMLKRASEAMVDMENDQEITQAIERAASEPLAPGAKRPAA